MQTPQQMSTEELLAKAIATALKVRTRPHFALQTKSGVTVALLLGDKQGATVNDELIRRAVNSFVAMREALEIALHVENDRRAGVELSDDDYSVLHNALTKALALADAK